MGKLNTMTDLQAFLKDAGCRMTVGAQGQQWAALIFKGNTQVAAAVNEDFATAVRDACDLARGEIERLNLSIH